MCDWRVSGQIHGCLGDSARPRSRARRHMRHEAFRRREGVAEANFFDERIDGAAEIVAAFAHQSEMRTVRVDAGRPHRACKCLGYPVPSARSGESADRAAVLAPGRHEHRRAVSSRCRRTRVECRLPCRLVRTGRRTGAPVKADAAPRLTERGSTRIHTSDGACIAQPRRDRPPRHSWWSACTKDGSTQCALHC